MDRAHRAGDRGLALRRRRRADAAAWDAQPAALDVRRAIPVRRSTGFVGILIFLAILGLCASASTHMGNIAGPWNWGNDNGDLFNMFGLPEH